MLLEKDIVGLAMENNTAFVESDGERYFIRSSKEAQAFLIQYQAEEMQKGVWILSRFRKNDFPPSNWHSKINQTGYFQSARHSVSFKMNMFLINTKSVRRMT